MQPESLETQQKVCLIENRSKAIEGNSSIKGMDAFKLNLVLYVVIPNKFKTPNFVKYNGTTCSKAHMTMFYRNMAGHMRNDKLLIHYF